MLLGWYWNHHIFPWDSDIDFQTTPTQFLKLLPFNNTRISPSLILDVNPNWRDRFHYYQNNNIIDARLISIVTGRFFDVTVLMENESGKIACKSPHFYKKEEIFPLIWTRLDGIGVNLYTLDF